MPVYAKGVSGFFVMNPMPGVADWINKQYACHPENSASQNMV